MAERRAVDALELLGAVLLSVATAGSAWCAYQSARWSGVQALSLATSNAQRAESLRASDRALTLMSLDVELFASWAEATSGGDEPLATFLRERFRAEFVPAFDAWIAEARPGRIPPGTPFTQPAYRGTMLAESERLAANAAASYEEARRANQRSDNYVFNVVVFASALFFVGVSSKIDDRRIRWALLGFASLLILLAVIFVLTLPKNVGFTVD